MARVEYRAAMFVSATAWAAGFPFRRCAAAMAAGLLLASPTMSTVRPPDEWMTVTDRSLEIATGSPLDFSAMANDLSGTAPIEIADGHFALDGRVPRINCAMLAPGFSETADSSFPDHATADRYADQLKRHGYNLVRFHYVDALLMGGATRDLAFNAVQLDRFEYLMAALKKRGIRWMIDLMSSDNAALGGVFPNRWSQNRGMLIRVFADPAALDHWRKLATKLLDTPNPYTGLTPAADPSTAALILVNEGVIDMQSMISGHGGFPDVLRQPYADWLKAQHLDPAASRALPQFADRDARMAQFQRFLNDRQIAVSGEMEKAVRAAGYSGPVSQFDNWAQLNALPSRRTLPFVDMHAYDQVPPGGAPGAQVKNLSSLSDGAHYLLAAAGTRFFGRPFTLSEHDQPFWNARRYESGLVAPALASLQGWDFICRHADGPIDLAYDGIGIRKQAIQPDGAGLDPVARAGETLTALLLLRHEIAPARPVVGLTISDSDALANGGWRELPRSLSIAAWIARIGLYDNRSRAANINPDLVLPIGPAPTRVERLAQSAKPQFAGTVPIVDALRKKGLLGPDNGTDALRNEWESPGGQVRLLGDRRELRVTTTFTSALAYERIDKPVALGPVRINAADQQGLVAFSALDGKPLGQSTRILVILASDARNTGMQVGPDGRLVKRGKLPVQIRRVRIDATLSAPSGSAWRLSPLRLNGTPDPAIRLTASAKGLSLPLDTALSPLGPTTFFLLTRS